MVVAVVVHEAHPLGPPCTEEVVLEVVLIEPELVGVLKNGGV